MDDNRPLISFNYARRYGVEIEVCSFDKRNFKAQPLDTGVGELPQGIHQVAVLLTEKLKTNVDIHKWQHTHNNQSWILKPDSSCGIEICSPVVKGWHGVKHVCEAIEALKTEDRVSVDDRCGLHVHVDVSDCDHSQLARIISYWIKCEAIFLDSVPASRKRNRYCQQIGATDLFSHELVSDEHVISKVGVCKYFTLNTYHLNKGKRHTIEFRIAEGQGCLDPFHVKNWIRLLIHFVETAMNATKLRDYQPGNQWSSFLWLDPDAVFEFLKFDDTARLSKGMQETRNWFLARIKANQMNSGLPGMWSNPARSAAASKLDQMIERFGLDEKFLIDLLRPEDMSNALWAAEARI